MNNKEALSEILKKYDPSIADLYKRIYRLERESIYRVKRNEIREGIKSLISEVVK